MPEYPSYEAQRETYLEWREYLQRFPWEWHCTLTFEGGSGYFLRLERFNRWRLRLIDREKIRVGGYLFSVSERGQKLFHALMLGQNEAGKTLIDCNRRDWESAWSPFFARIKPVTTLYGACDYVSKHFMGFISQHTEAESFNRTLLRQAMRRHCGFISNFDGLGCPGD
jgi:hypothetical protein